MDFNVKQAKQWSRLGPRAVYGMAMLELMQKNERVYALSADLGVSSGLQRVMKAYPQRYLNTGIAEQNLIGVSAGLAKEGLVPFASSFAPFITLRCADQVRMNMGYMHLNMKTVALGSGVSMSSLGNSHYGNEDLAFMRSIPGMTILSPADCGQLTQAVYAAAEWDGPVYIRLTGEPNMPIVYEESGAYEIGRATVLKKGKDVTLIATGSMVALALETADTLKTKGIEAGVIDMHTLKPLDTGCLDDVCGSSKLLATIEEHGKIGGLGSAVAEYVAQMDQRAPLLMFGIPDRYMKAGDYSYMLEQSGLTVEHIVSAVCDKLT